MIIIIDFGVLLDAFPMEAQSSVNPVVISPDQVLVSVETLNDSDTVFFVFPERVPKHINRIVLCDPFIPVLDQNIIHLISVCERTVIKPKNVFMTEMKVCDIINHNV